MSIKRYALQLSYSVSDEEKEKAEKALSYYNFLLRTMKEANEHLDLIYIPFKDGTPITPDQAWKARAALRRYRDADIEIFNKFKKIAFKCFSIMHEFSTDTQVVKLNKAFVLSIGDIEKQVNRFSEIFSDLKSKDFGSSIIKCIENIKKEIAQLEQIVEDRIMAHIESQILNRTWVDLVSKELQQKIEEKIPSSIKMVEQRKGKTDQDPFLFNGTAEMDKGKEDPLKV
jgi:hypothetical protein